jgi:hypothetical protein
MGVQLGQGGVGLTRLHESTPGARAAPSHTGDHGDRSSARPGRWLGGWSGWWTNGFITLGDVSFKVNFLYMRFFCLLYGLELASLFISKELIFATSACTIVLIIIGKKFYRSYNWNFQNWHNHVLHGSCIVLCVLPIFHWQFSWISY